MTDENKSEREREEEEEDAESTSEKEEDEAVETEAAEEVPVPVAPEPNWGYPAFAREFPRDEELDALVETYASGNYLAVREGVTKLLAREELDADVKKAAVILRERTEPDRTARIFFYLAAGLLFILTTYWLTHNGPDHHVSPPATPVPAPEIVK